MPTDQDRSVRNQTSLKKGCKISSGVVSLPQGTLQSGAQPCGLRPGAVSGGSPGPQPAAEGSGRRNSSRGGSGRESRAQRRLPAGALASGPRCCLRLRAGLAGARTGRPEAPRRQVGGRACGAPEGEAARAAQGLRGRLRAVWSAEATASRGPEHQSGPLLPAALCPSGLFSEESGATSGERSLGSGRRASVLNFSVAGTFQSTGDWGRVLKLCSYFKVMCNPTNSVRMVQQILLFVVSPVYLSCLIESNLGTCQDSL